MDRSEPSLVPQWLKNSGSSTGGGDNHPASRVARNKSFVNTNGNDFGRASGSAKTTSSYFRRSSSSNSSGSSKSYSSFGRNQRDRDWEKDTYNSRDKERLVLGGDRHRYESSELLGNPSLSKYERDGLRRSHSMISGKHGETWPKKVVTESSSGSGKNNGNGFLAKGSPVGVANKATFERDFPSLGTDDRAVVPEVGRVASPGLSSALQSLPIGSSASIGGERWTSALAEVPMLVVSNGTASLSVQQAAPSSTTASVVVSSTTSLNMAEAVAQGPTRAQTAPQLSLGTQRLEELAIKQSRQLIPVTPTMPKTLVLSSSDKQKSKVGLIQQHPTPSSLPINQSPRGAPPSKPDFSKASNVGKLHVLKPVREKNGVTPSVKDKLSPTGSGKAVNSTLPASPSAVKPLLTTALEKRPTTQAQSRNDFFKRMREKSVSNSSSASETGTAISPEKHAKVAVVPAAITGAVEPLPEEKAVRTTCNGGVQHISNGKKYNSEPIISEEEEAKFLRSMGWDENDDEGGLTEEEISAFYRDFTKIGGISPGLSSSDAKLES
ncbi:hypothetical protein ABFS82_02G064900 [Erythranthe guttata]|uniref:uncharacterized protein LOC105949617 isoform X2 n=1 Tax=Erythranthe guttata TaxID=4155 RepID=UPI00064DE509|nr:PREDICTED: uncharacterized protein LOC105949617 isoform X2 [Erythranthe guttata]|eukprot:XP_012828377.1 PREDICTED: uncharacterized protein LOC105949617 isoform X2 [Erythranthe guttata]